ncbi:hypothetical protein CPB83DRAFT_899894 [Crepidotus variabilis]|uniref:Uncharacterized protein n=1 Tax=Crepidotus variabilis TaxID=179855 RepID=A0A9P6E3Z9_9AGAR|nr:hypothetical protein CPB83DRAFT_899894 [Crepidotus variabilis]
MKISTTALVCIIVIVTITTILLRQFFDGACYLDFIGNETCACYDAEGTPFGSLEVDGGAQRSNAGLESARAADIEVLKASITTLNNTIEVLKLEMQARELRSTNNLNYSFRHCNLIETDINTIAAPVYNYGTWQWDQPKTLMASSTLQVPDLTMDVTAAHTTDSEVMHEASVDLQALLLVQEELASLQVSHINTPSHINDSSTVIPATHATHSLCHTPIFFLSFSELAQMILQHLGGGSSSDSANHSRGVAYLGSTTNASATFGYNDIQQNPCLETSRSIVFPIAADNTTDCLAVDDERDVNCSMPLTFKVPTYS